MTNRRILLLVPHPDDEIVGCAIAIRREIAAGAQVFALYLTTGVPARNVLWPWQRPFHAARLRRRREEAGCAAAQLGIAPLGFLAVPSRALKSHLGDTLARIRAAISTHAIDLLWVPAWEGAHQDHDVANFLAARLASECPVMEFAEYHFHDGRVGSGRFARTLGSERVLTLTPEEARWKRSLLALYRSERGNLAHIGCETEALRPLPPHDYAKRPHAGTLFYERFHWVPLRHPRIDFERPERVCETLTAFAAAERRAPR